MSSEVQTKSPKIVVYALFCATLCFISSASYAGTPLNGAVLSTGYLWHQQNDLSYHGMLVDGSLRLAVGPFSALELGCAIPYVETTQLMEGSASSLPGEHDVFAYAGARAIVDKHDRIRSSLALSLIAPLPRIGLVLQDSTWSNPRIGANIGIDFDVDTGALSSVGLGLRYTLITPVIQVQNGPTPTSMFAVMIRFARWR